MGWLDSFLHPGKGYEKGQEQLNQYYNQGQGYLQPYNQYGQDVHANLSDAMRKMLDPAALEAEWINSYSESPSAKNAEAMAQQHGLDAASSLGLMGSNTALNAIQEGTSEIGMNDRQNYLNDLMQKYLSGVNTASNIYNTGASTAGTMGTNAMNMGQNSAQMAYGQQAAGGNMMSGLLGAGIGAVGSALGGPIGGMVGNALAKKWNFSGGA